MIGWNTLWEEFPKSEMSSDILKIPKNPSQNPFRKLLYSRGSSPIVSSSLNFMVASSQRKLLQNLKTDLESGTAWGLYGVSFRRALSFIIRFYKISDDLRIFLCEPYESFYRFLCLSRARQRNKMEWPIVPSKGGWLISQKIVIANLVLNGSPL